MNHITQIGSVFIRMSGFLLIVTYTFLALVGCGNSPSAPSSPTGTIGARIDTRCGDVGVQSVEISIDGVVAGSAGPGGAVTKVAQVGTHSITGRATVRPGWSGKAWNSGTVVTTAANPDDIRLFACPL